MQTLGLSSALAYIHKLLGHMPAALGVKPYRTCESLPKQHCVSVDGGTSVTRGAPVSRCWAGSHNWTERARHGSTIPADSLLAYHVKWEHCDWRPAPLFMYSFLFFLLAAHNDPRLCDDRHCIRPHRNYRQGSDLELLYGIAAFTDVEGACIATQCKCE